MDDRQRLVGVWERVAPADDPYPDRLVFSDDGLYRGEVVEPGTFTLWDVGTYSVAGDGEIAISTANDAVVRYGYRLRDDRLTFAVDDGGESWTYVRSDDDGPWSSAVERVLLEEGPAVDGGIDVVGGVAEQPGDDIGER